MKGVISVLSGIALTAGLGGSALALSTCVENPSCEQHFPNSSARRLAPAELAGLSPSTLWEARNEIFARNGYIFSSARGRRFFGSKSYYVPRSRSVDLNAVERANVALIKAYEEGRGPAVAPVSRPPQAPVGEPRVAGRPMVVRGLNQDGDGFLALRAGPGSAYAMLGRLGEGEDVVSLGRSGEWHNVRTWQGVGWVHGGWLADNPIYQVPRNPVVAIPAPTVPAAPTFAPAAPVPAAPAASSAPADTPAASAPPSGIGGISDGVGAVGDELGTLGSAIDRQRK